MEIKIDEIKDTFSQEYFLEYPNVWFMEDDKLCFGEYNGNRNRNKIQLVVSKNDRNHVCKLEDVLVTEYVDYSKNDLEMLSASLFVNEGMLDFTNKVYKLDELEWKDFIDVIDTLEMLLCLEIEDDLRKRIDKFLKWYNYGFNSMREEEKRRLNEIYKNSF